MFVNKILILNNKFFSLSFLLSQTTNFLSTSGVTKKNTQVKPNICFALSVKLKQRTPKTTYNALLR